VNALTGGRRPDWRGLSRSTLSGNEPSAEPCKPTEPERQAARFVTETQKKPDYASGWKIPPQHLNLRRSSNDLTNTALNPSAVVACFSATVFVNTTFAIRWLCPSHNVCS
jgi:hypothetical protein